MTPRDYSEINGKIMKCKCPKCKKWHKMRALWIGNTPFAYKYCPPCRSEVDDLSTGTTGEAILHRGAMLTRL